MSFEFPPLHDTPIDPRRSWSASFVSYDQRNEDVYYWVILKEDGREAAGFMAQVSLYWAGEDWRVPEFLDGLRGRIQDVALSGKANTSYKGPMGFHRK